VTLHVRGKDIHCECEDADLYAAIDLLVDKLDRQVLKYKGKRYSTPHDATQAQDPVTEHGARRRVATHASYIIRAL
jgi:putative sigma-54 modulation protein